MTLVPAFLYGTSGAAITAALGDVGPTPVETELEYQGSVDDSGAGPFDFDDFDTGDVYSGRQLLILVYGTKNWNNSGAPTLDLSVNGGDTLTPIASQTGSSGGLFSMGRRFNAYLIPNEDATIDMDVVSSDTLAIVRIFVYSMSNGMTLLDTQGYSGGISSGDRDYTNAIPNGGALIGLAVGRSTSGSGGVTCASHHPSGGASSTTYNYSIAAVTPPNAITWNGLTEDDQYGAIGNTNYEMNLYLLFEYITPVSGYTFHGEYTDGSNTTWSFNDIDVASSVGGSRKFVIFVLAMRGFNVTPAATISGTINGNAPDRVLGNISGTSASVSSGRTLEAWLYEDVSSTELDIAVTASDSCARTWVAVYAVNNASDDFRIQSALSTSNGSAHEWNNPVTMPAGSVLLAFNQHRVTSGNGFVTAASKLFATEDAAFVASFFAGNPYTDMVWTGLVEDSQYGNVGGTSNLCTSMYVGVSGIMPEMEFTVAIPAGKTGSTLTNFPVYIDLSNAPSSFWSNVARDGGDIHAYIGSTRLPIDRVEWDYDNETGGVFVLVPSLTTAGVNITLKIDGWRAAEAVDATYGSRAVWAGYAMFAWYPSGSRMNRKTGTNPTVTGTPTADDDNWMVLGGSADLRYDSLGHSQIWSTGVRAYTTAGFGSNQALTSYSTNSSTDGDRAGPIFRNTTEYGVWDSSNLWISGGIPVNNVPATMGVWYNGTASRSLFANGGLIGTSGGSITARPQNSGQSLFVGKEDTSNGNRFTGGFQYAWLRLDIVGADWYETEDEMITDNAGFLSISEA